MPVLGLAGMPHQQQAGKVLPASAQAMSWAPPALFACLDASSCPEYAATCLHQQGSLSEFKCLFHV